MWIENKTWLLHKANVNLNNRYNKGETLIGSLVKRKHISINIESTLRKAIEKMAAENIDVLPVLSKENGHVIGILSYKNIISSL